MINTNDSSFEGIKEEDIFKVWSKYEDIAMHFNELIIKFRIQALGGLGVFVTILMGLKEKINNEFMGNVCLFFLACWIAVFILDFCYYRKLLMGAVKAITEIEKKSQYIKFSCQIKRSAKV